MMSGYFNHEESALALTKLLGKRKTILDLGIGTGMLTEKILTLSDQYNITGIDFSDRMLKQAKARLHSYKNVTMIANDVRDQTFDVTFDAVISTARPISLIAMSYNLISCLRWWDFTTREMILHIIFVYTERSRVGDRAMNENRDRSTMTITKTPFRVTPGGTAPSQEKTGPLLVRYIIIME